MQSPSSRRLKYMVHEATEIRGFRADIDSNMRFISRWQLKYMVHELPETQMHGGLRRAVNLLGEASVPPH